MERERTIFDSVESLSLDEEEKNQIYGAKNYRITIDTPFITNIQLSDIIAISLENGCFPVYEEIVTLDEVF